MFWCINTYTHMYVCVYTMRHICRWSYLRLVAPTWNAAGMSVMYVGMYVCMYICMHEYKLNKAFLQFGLTYV